MRREVEAPGENRGGGASAAGMVRRAAEAVGSRAACGVKGTAWSVSCSVVDETAGADAGSAGRDWQQEACVPMEPAHCMAMWRQQAWPAGAEGRTHANAGTAATKTTSARTTAAIFLFQATI